MGNKESKGKDCPPGIVFESEEYWWWQAGKTFAPIETPEEFCERFKAPKELCMKGVLVYDCIKNDVPEGEEPKPYITLEQWLRSAPNEAHKKWSELIFNAFDTDRDGKFTLEEFLAYFGVMEKGTLEQRVMGKFMLCDLNHDHKIDREEMATVLRASFARNQKPQPEKTDLGLSPEDDFKLRLAVLFEMLDTNGNGTFELNEIIKAARKDKRVASLFSI